MLRLGAKYGHLVHNVVHYGQALALESLLQFLPLERRAKPRVVERDVQAQLGEFAFKFVAGFCRWDEDHHLLSLYLRNAKQRRDLLGTSLDRTASAQECNVRPIHVSHKDDGIWNPERRKETALHLSAGGGGEGEDRR